MIYLLHGLLTPTLNGVQINELIQNCLTLNYFAVKVVIEIQYVSFGGAYSNFIQTIIYYIMYLCNWYRIFFKNPFL